MPRYVSLAHWTKQGITDYADTVARCARFTERVERNGGKVLQLVWTVGDYDLVVVTEFPDEETAMAVMLKAGGQGDVRTVTMQAFTSDEMERIISRATQMS